MKISLNWLKNSDFLNWPEDLTDEKLIDQLPMAGFEIDGVEKIGDDTVLDISITANRGDCLSVRGLLREIACLNHLMFNDIILTLPNVGPAVPSIQIDAPEACGIYSARFIRHIDNKKALPVEMIDRLKKSGIESINPIVDICNYVMLELGQPLHAFDAEYIHDIQVRLAKENERLQVLGANTINLKPNTLIISTGQKSDKGQTGDAEANFLSSTTPIAIAGIIGGLDSAVTTETQDIFLESAHFVPEFIAGRARQYGLQTEAAQRFERGVDPALPLTALKHASDLILQHLGGQAEAIQSTSGAPLPVISKIILRPERINRILGMTIEPNIIFDTLTALGMHVKTFADHYEVHSPSFRFDVKLEVDLIEELARIQGYRHIPTHAPHISQISSDPFLQPKNLLSQYLVNAGYHEVITYSFIAETLHKTCFGNQPAVRLKNPLSSEFAIMRTSIWPSLLTTWEYNANRQQNRARLFEFGTVYQAEADAEKGTVVQIPVLAGLVTGAVAPEQWSDGKRLVDFFDVKNDVENLLKLFFAPQQIEFREKTEDDAMFRKKQYADIWVNDALVGRIGRLHAALQQHFKLSDSVFLFEIFLNRLPKISVKKFSPISRFPSVRRDFAFLMPRHQNVGDVLAFVQQTLGKLCRQVVLFDIYEGKNLPAGQKSVAFGVLLQSITETLADEQVNILSTQLIEALREKFGMVLREG